MSNILTSGVAKSYIGLEKLCEPYKADNGKAYIKVMLKSGNAKEVRWYGDMPKPWSKGAKPYDKYYKTQKETLGFTPSIYIFRGDTYAVKDELKAMGARFATCFGWYLTHERKSNYKPIEGIEPVVLEWDLVGNEDETLKSDEEVKAVVDKLLYPDDPNTTFVGEIGDRLDLHVTITKVIDSSNRWGDVRTHIFEDDNNNTFSWTTSSKHWEVGEEKVIRGTVKDHNTYKGQKTTVLTRCKEI